METLVFNFPNFINSEPLRNRREFLDLKQVRSSIAKRLGIELAGAIEPERHINDIVEMMLDATQRYDFPLTITYAIAKRTPPALGIEEEILL